MGALFIFAVLIFYFGLMGGLAWEHYSEHVFLRDLRYEVERFERLRREV